MRAVGLSLLDELTEYQSPKDGDDLPMTAVESRRIKPGSEEEFEVWLSGILDAANEFTGYLGSNDVRPSGPEDDEYQIVFKFDHASNLKRWERSEERRRWLHESRDLIKEEPRIQILTGLET